MFKILYVDDEPDLLDISRLFLEKSGQMQVDTLTSAKEALEKLATSAYDAIISDYQMPGMDGISFLKALREKKNATPFILFTGRGREEVVIQALNNGADFYLQKGGDPESQFAELDYKIRLIVGQRRTQQELLAYERRMADIIDFLPDATFAVNTEKKVIAWNRAIADLTGVAREEVLGKGDYAYAVPFYGKRRPSLIDLVFQEDKAVEKNYLYVRKRGGQIVAETYIPALNGGKGAYIWAIASPLYDPAGRVTGAIESIRDITDRRRIEDALCESERKYRDTVEDQTEFICRFRPDGTHVFVNEAYCRYFRKKRGDIIGKKFIPVIPEEDRQRLRQHLSALTPERPVQEIDHRIVMPSGEVRWQRWSDRAIFNKTGQVVEYQSVGRDITETKHAQDAIFREKLFSDAVIECIPGAFFVVDRRGRYVRCNRFMQDALGLDADRLGNNPALMPVLEEDRPAVRAAMDRVFSEGHAEIRARVVGKRKLVRDIFLTGLRMRIGDDDYIVGTGIDMTEKYQSFRALEESGNRYRTLFDSTGTAMFILEEDMTISLANTEFEKMSGYTRREVEGKMPWTRLVVAEDAVWMKELHFKRRQENPPPDLPRNYEFRFVDRKKAVRTMYLSIALLANRKQTIVSLVDITERKRLEAALQAANTKLTLLSRLTRHDILNNLTLLQSTLHLAQMKTGDPEGQRQWLGKAARAGAAIHAQVMLTKQYQDIGMQKPAWQEIAGVLRNACRDGDFPPVSTGTGLDGTEVFADPLFPAVFANLFQNAVMHGGHVTRIHVSGSVAPGRFTLVVEDDGIGIPLENKQKIFGNGFGSNTGYGLFMVQEVLAITGLSISETGEPGRGARFEIRMPDGTWRKNGAYSETMPVDR